MARKATGKANGRPVYKPTDDDRKTVSLMCAVGIPHEGIAMCIGDSGIDDKTLRKHFPKELATSKIKANTKIAGSIFNAALSGNMTAATLWARTQMGWKDTSAIQLTAKIEHSKIDMDTLTDGDLISIERILERIIIAGDSSREDEEIS